MAQKYPTYLQFGHMSELSYFFFWDPSLTGFMKPAIFSYLEMEWPTRGNEASSSILMALLNYEEWAHVRNTEGGHEE